MEFQTRSITSALNALVAKLEILPENHPDRPNLIRMILGLRDASEALSLHEDEPLDPGRP